MSSQTQGTHLQGPAPSCLPWSSWSPDSHTGTAGAQGARGARSAFLRASSTQRDTALPQDGSLQGQEGTAHPRFRRQRTGSGTARETRPQRAGRKRDGDNWPSATSTTGQRQRGNDREETGKFSHAFSSIQVLQTIIHKLTPFTPTKNRT